jgi:uncharacterized protein YcbK (DUF882 family)
VKALVLLLLLTGAAAAQTKKDDYWADKKGAHEPLRKIDRKKLVGKKPDEVISIWNTWTHEWVAVDGKAKSVPQPQVDRLLRCHFTNQPTDMDGRLAGVLLEAARHFHAHRVNIVSGYRAPKYNLMLRKKGHNVAKDSEHTKGHAVDFWLPRVDVKDLYDWAMAHQIGGVGFYAQSGFVHVDVGRKRTWNGE